MKAPKLKKFESSEPKRYFNSEANKGLNPEELLKKSPEEEKKEKVANDVPRQDFQDEFIKKL